MHDELSIGMADVWLASDFGGAAMSERNTDWRETVFARDKTIASMQERILALEAERDALKHDFDVLAQSVLAWKARVAELEKHAIELHSHAHSFPDECQYCGGGREIGE